MAGKRQAVLDELETLRQDAKDLLVTLKSDPKEQARKERRWRILYGALAALATVATRQVAAKAWGVLTGELPPAKREVRVATRARVAASAQAPEDEPVARERYAGAAATREVRERSAPREKPDGSTEPVVKDAPMPQPERHEPKLDDPGLTDLSRRDWKAILIRAGKESLDDNVPMIASALAYASFFAIPSLMLVALGVFTLVAGPETITRLMNTVTGVIPGDAVGLLEDSLQRMQERPSSGLVMTILGLILAVWSTTSAMTTYQAALNLAYDRKDSRSFVKKRLIALAMVACVGGAFLLLATLLILGPFVQEWIGDALGFGTVFSVAWWIVQWPILLVGLLAAFATILYLGPDVEQPKWQFISPGAVIAAFAWLAASGLFAVYTSMFASYNKTWGSISAVIVMLTWLWLTGLALLFGAEVNAEAERSRELRAGESDGTLEPPRKED